MGKISQMCQVGTLGEKGSDGLFGVWWVKRIKIVGVFLSLKISQMKVLKIKYQSLENIQTGGGGVILAKVKNQTLIEIHINY